MLEPNPRDPKHTNIVVILSVPFRSIHNFTTDCAAIPTA